MYCIIKCIVQGKQACVKNADLYCIITCIVQGKQARVKNADLRHPSCTVVM